MLLLTELAGRAVRHRLPRRRLLDRGRRRDRDHRRHLGRRRASSASSTEPPEHAVLPLPPPRRPGRYAVALVCLGNICRSPMADVVLERLRRDARARRPGHGHQLRHRRLARRQPDGPAGRGDADRGRLRPDAAPGAAVRPGWLERQRPGARDGRPEPRRRAARRRRRPRTDGGCGCSATSTRSNRGATCRTRTTVGTPGSRRCWRWSSGRPPRSSPRSRAEPALSSTTRPRRMTRQPLVARHAEELLGSSVVATAPGRRRRHRDRHQAAALRRHHRADEDATARPRGLLRRRGGRAALAGRGDRDGGAPCPRCSPSTTSA